MQPTVRLLHRVALLPRIFHGLVPVCRKASFYGYSLLALLLCFNCQLLAHPYAYHQIGNEILGIPRFLAVAGAARTTTAVDAPPKPPASLGATGITKTEVYLEMAADQEIEVDSLVLERALTSEGVYTVIATLNGNETTFVDERLQAGTSYTYRLKAVNAEGSSDYISAQATTHPSVNVQTQWNQRYGGSDQDWLSTLIRTADGGYLLGGRSLSSATGDHSQPGRGDADYWVVKLDAQGGKLWDKRYGGSGEDALEELVATADGGYLLGGTSASGTGGDRSESLRGATDYWLVKIDAEGNKLWDHRYGGSGQDVLQALIKTIDGGYLLGGASASGADGDKSQPSQGGRDYWVVKVDAAGVKQWDQRFGGDGDDGLAALVENTDGSYLLGGTSLSSVSGDQTQEPLDYTGDGYDGDYWIVKINSTGAKQWDRRYGGEWPDILSALIKTSDGGYLLGGSGKARGPNNHDTCGEPLDFGYAIWIVRIDSSGKALWDKTYFGGPFLGYIGNDFLNTLLATNDGGYLLGGSSQTNRGNAKSEHSWGGSGFNLCDHGGINHSPSVDYWIIQLNSDGSQRWDKDFGGYGTDDLRALVQDVDGSLVLAGYSNSGVDGDKTQDSRGKSDYWVVKTDPSPNCPSLAFTPVTGSVLPTATIGQAYQQAIAVDFSGYSFTATGLPTGLSISAEGLISGIPTAATGSPDSVKVTAINGTCQATATYFLAISQRVLSFTLIDARTGKDIRPLQEGDLLNLLALPKQLSVRANTDPMEVGSVVFGLNDQPEFRVENYAPYALASNNPDDSYVPYAFQAGQYVLKATPYRKINGQGEKGEALSIHFQVGRPKVANFTLVNAATGKDIQSLKEGDVLDLAKLPAQLSIRANTLPSPVGSVVFDLNEKDAIQVANFLPYALTGPDPAANGHFLFQFGSEGSGEGQLNHPAGVALDGFGNLYVADQGNRRIQKFDASGHFLFQFGEGKLSRPTGVALDGSGNLYVADGDSQHMVKFDSSGRMLFQFGSEGGGGGQFRDPNGVAVDGSNNFYVADYHNDRIQKFSSLGTYLSQFGTFGFGGGSFQRVARVTVDNLGNLYVADVGNHRVAKFDSTYRFLFQFGGEGSGEGKLDAPNYGAVDVRGNLYVTDQGSHRIQKYDSTGRFLSRFGSQGNGEGEFQSPSDLVFDGSGKLYVSDYGNHRIQVISTATYLPYSFQIGDYALTATPYSQGNGQGEKGGGLTVNFRVIRSAVEDSVTSFTLINAGTGEEIQPLKEGDVLNLSTLPTRLSVRANTNPQAVGSVIFDLNGRSEFRVENFAPYALASNNPDDSYMPYDFQAGDYVLSATPYSQANGQGKEGLGLTVNFQVVNSRSEDRVTNFTLLDAATGQDIQPLKEGDVLDLATLPAQLSIRANTEPRQVGSVVFGLNDKPDLRVENSVPYALAGTQPDSSFLFKFQFGGYGSGQGQLNSPWGVTFDNAGNLYVAEESNHRIQKFSSSGRSLATFGSYGSGEGQFNSPLDVAVDGSGNVYGVDHWNHRIVKFDSTGRFLLQFGSEGSGQEQLERPAGVAVDGSGNVYVADHFNHRIVEFDSQGRFLLQFGSFGSGEGQLNHPIGIAFDGSGNVYVGDRDNHRIVKFSPSGHFLFQFGSQGSGQGQFSDLYGVVVDNNGNLVVADTYNHRIQKFSPAGRFLLQFGSYGTGEGQFDYPNGVAVDGSGNLFVSDQNNHRIQVFSSGGYLPYAFQVGYYALSATPYNQSNGQGKEGLGLTVNFQVVNSRSEDRVTNFTLLDAATGQDIQPLKEGDVLDLATLPAQLTVRANTQPAGVGSVVFGLNDKPDLRVENSAPYTMAGTEQGDRFLFKFGSYGSGEGQLNQPHGVALDGSGNIFVTDLGNKRIVKFSSSGHFLFQFGSEGNGDGQFQLPLGLALDGSGNLYVADAGNHRIQKFDSSGRFAFSIR